MRKDYAILNYIMNSGSTCISSLVLHTSLVLHISLVLHTGIAVL